MTIIHGRSHPRPSIWLCLMGLLASGGCEPTGPDTSPVCGQELLAAPVRDDDRLTDVHGSSLQDIHVVGDDLHLQWDGQEWHDTRTDPRKGTGDPVRYTSIWAGVPGMPLAGRFVSDLSYVYDLAGDSTLWGATHWVNDVWAASPTVISFTGFTYDLAYWAFYDGTSGRLLGLPPSDNPNRRILAVAGSGAGDIYAVGSEAYYFDGDSVTTLSGPGAPPGGHDVWVGSPDNVLIAGWHGIFHYDGSTWMEIDSVRAGAISAVQGHPDIWVIDRPRVGHFDGAEWTWYDGLARQVFWKQDSVDVRLNSLWAAGADTVFLVGGNGTLKMYDGERWQRLGCSSP